MTTVEGPVAVHPRWEGMSGPERVWYERLCRKLGCNRVCGPTLDLEGVHVAHKLLDLRQSGAGADDPEVVRLFAELEGHQRRVEDEHAARLGLPPRPSR
jgi:hypothetical protein